MKLKIYQIDAFTDQLFKGNPAAVCPLDEWIADETLLNIAIENNLAETAFFVPLSANRFHLRWFTPELEMDLCGHATLATAFVIFEELKHKEDTIFFETKSGSLSVKKEDASYVLDFPSRPPQPATLPKIICDALNIQPTEVWKSRDYLLVYDSEDDVRNIIVNVAILNEFQMDSTGGIIVSAKGNTKNIDFVSRFFTPRAAVFEDPVTGSAHCTLTPFWAKRFDKNTLNALQLSERSGALQCQLQHDRVKIKGKAVKYLEGTINC